MKAKSLPTQGRMMRLLFQPSDAAEELLDDSSNDNGSLIDLGRPPRPPHHTNQPFTATSPVALVLGMIFVSIIVLILGGTAYQREGPPHGVQVVAVWIGVLATAIGVFYEFLDCHELPCDTPPGYHFGHSCLDAAGLAIVCALVFTLDGYGVCCGRPHPGRTAAFHGAASVFLLVKAVYAVAEGSELIPGPHLPPRKEQKQELLVRLRLAALGAAAITTLLTSGLTLVRRSRGRRRATVDPRRSQHFNQHHASSHEGPRPRHAQGLSGPLMTVEESASELRYNSSAESLAPPSMIGSTSSVGNVSAPASPKVGRSRSSSTTSVLDGRAASPSRT